jgi:hypothetical protein
MLYTFPETTTQQSSRVLWDCTAAADISFLELAMPGRSDYLDNCNSDSTCRSKVQKMSDVHRLIKHWPCESVEGVLGVVPGTLAASPIYNRSVN